MKPKILNLLLILTSLLGYLEWGTNERAFVFETEGEIFTKLFTDPQSVLHPFVLLPLFGQILLLIAALRKQPSKLLSLLGFWSIAVLLLFMFFIGILAMNYKIILSVVPFLVTGVLLHLYYRKPMQN